MKTYKVIAKVDKGNGLEDYTLFIKAENEQEAERSAKYYVIEGLNLPFYGVHDNIKEVIIKKYE